MIGIVDADGWSQLWPRPPGYWPTCDVPDCGRMARWEKPRPVDEGGAPFYLCDDHHARTLG